MGNEQVKFRETASENLKWYGLSSQAYSLQLYQKRDSGIAVFLWILPNFW